MAEKRVVFDGAGAASFLLALSCATTSATTSETPSAPAPDEASSESVESRRSEKFAYSWVLPNEWDFIPVEKPGTDLEKAPYDLIAARWKGAETPLVTVIVVDVTTVIPGQVLGTKPEHYDGLENYGADVVREHGFRVSDTRRVKMLGTDAVQVSAAAGEQEFSVRLLYRGRRKFEFRCLGSRAGAEWPCRSAFTGFEIAEVVEERTDADMRRVLHLRDERFGIEFDPPDDSWLGFGPRVGGGGTQFIWIWNSDDRQIDAQVIDLSSMSSPPAAGVVVAGMADGMRRDGATVAMKKSTLAGEPCEHLKIDRADGTKQDLFMLIRDGMNYGLLITQRERDPELIARVKKGFRFTKK